jgi:hypothetical protein
VFYVDSPVSIREDVISNLASLELQSGQQFNNLNYQFNLENKVKAKIELGTS